MCHEIFVSHNVHRILGLRGALTDENLEELLHLEGLPLNKPIPPFGVVNRKVVLGLVTVADSVAEGTIRREHVQWVSYADESLVRVHWNGTFDIEGVVRLGDPNIITTVTLALETHDLEGSRCVD